MGYSRKMPAGLFKPGTTALEKVLHAIRYYTDYPDTHPCWMWPWAMRGRGGAGAVQETTPANAKRSKCLYPHRVAYEFFIGAIPAGMVLDHRCGNRICINPFHLEVVTINENSRRGNREPDPLYLNNTDLLPRTLQLSLWDDEEDAA